MVLIGERIHPSGRKKLGLDMAAGGFARVRRDAPGQVARLMRELGGPLTWPEREPAPSADEVKFAFLNAPLIRRLTLGDRPIF